MTWTLMAGLAWAGGCRDDQLLTPGPAPESPLIISDPASSGVAALPSAAQSVARSGTGVVYVSLPPGAIPNGELAILRNRRTGYQVTRAVVHGGFDPVPVEGSVGDTLDVEIQVACGAPQLYALAVPAARRPSVVRTDPPPGKRDVSLNASIVIVFSEPIDPATLTATSVQLRRGTAVVPGRLEFRDAFHLMVAFVPAEPLAAEATYELMVTQAVADLDGERLEAPVDLTFTTTTQPAGSRLEFIVQPTSTTAGTVISPAIQVAVTDGAGNTVTTATDSVTVAIGNNPNRGTLSGTRTVAAVSGVATFSDLSLDKTADGDATGYTLTASAAGLATATSASFRVAPAPALALTFYYQPSHAIAGLPFWHGVSVQARDSFGNLEPGFSGVITLTIGANPGGGALSGVTSRSAVGEYAFFSDLRIDQAGRGYTLVASASGLRSATSLPFDVGPPIGQATNVIAFASVQSGVSLLDLDSGGLAALGQYRWPVGWSPDGSKILLVEPWVGPFPYVMVADGSQVTRLPGFGAWSPDGARIAFASDRDGAPEIYVMNADGSAITRVTHVGGAGAPSWSPDGSKLAFLSSFDIYVVNPDGSAITRLTRMGGAGAPSWSPDGSQLAFVSNADLYVVNPDGSAVARLTDMGSVGAPSWSPDGSQLAFLSNSDIYVVHADGSAIARLTNMGSVWAPVWAPDGSKLAFFSSDDIYAVNRDGSQVSRLTNTATDGTIIYGFAWSPDGAKLAFSGVTDAGLSDVWVMNADGSGITAPIPPVIIGDGCEPGHSGGCMYTNRTAPAWRPLPRP